MPKILVRSVFGYDVDAVSNESALSEFDESMAVQSERDEVDINMIIARFLKTGVLPRTLRVPRQGDFTEVKSMQESLDLVLQAEDEFMKLPAQMRARFHHDAAEFVDFCSSDKNRKELEELGMAVLPLQEPKPVRVVVDAPKEAPKAP